MSDKDRIRLAEAMGWVRTTGYQENPMSGRQPFERWSKRGGDVYDYLPFDPFTDANDDYAVLEWMRGDDAPTLEFGIELRRALYEPGHYRIGDYARAALKVIEVLGDE